MDQKKKYILICSITGVILLLVGVFAFTYSVLARKIKMNPAGTVGNTAGNINNRGLFCEHDGKVYFANPKDKGTLYVMNPDESGQQKLNDIQICNLLGGGEYLYYFQLGAADRTDIGGMIASSHAFYRSNLQGKDAVNITKDVIVSGQLSDNYLYLLAAGKEHPEFYKIKIDKSDRVHLADYNINPACVSNGILYYNNTREDHALYALNTANDTASVVWYGNLWYPIVDGDYVYFMDVANNYRLCRYSLTDQVVEVLTNDRVDCFNVGSGYIYYQKNSATDPQLKCMHTDGSNVLVIAEGNYTYINMTSQYVYFLDFETKSTLYHSRLGSDWYGSF